LTPKESFFLYQNLQLQLETARLAAMRHDEASFTASLKTARSWLDKYFDSESTDVTAFAASLEGLSGLDIDPPLPDISSALTALRAHTRGEDKRAGPAAAPASSTGDAQ